MSGSVAKTKYDRRVSTSLEPGLGVSGGGLAAGRKRCLRSLNAEHQCKTRVNHIEAHICYFVLQTLEQFVKGSIPPLKCLCKIPTGRLRHGIRKCDRGVFDDVKRGDECSEERLEELDKYGLECTQKFIDVCEL